MEQDRWSLFKCQRCGQCCEKLGLPWPWPLSKLDEIADFLKIDPEGFVTRYYGNIIMENGERIVKLDRNRTTPCQFLEQDKGCRIYPVRPNECKAYPIETDFGRCEVHCPAMTVFDAMDSEGVWGEGFLHPENKKEEDECMKKERKQIKKTKARLYWTFPKLREFEGKLG